MHASNGQCSICQLIWRKLFKRLLGKMGVCYQHLAATMICTIVSQCFQLIHSPAMDHTPSGNSLFSFLYILPALFWAQISL